MKKYFVITLILIILLSMLGCGAKPVGKVIEGNVKTYCIMPDGTWQCEGCSYEHRTVISGKMPNAAKETTFVYLSNLEVITFEQAWKAADLSSNTGDYFGSRAAVLVEMKTE